MCEVHKPEKHQAYPPIQSGTQVVTLQPNVKMRREWTEVGWASKKPGFRGRVVGHSDSHGLCYHVVHDDGTDAWYDPSELVEIATKPYLAVCYPNARGESRVTDDPRVGAVRDTFLAESDDRAREFARQSYGLSQDVELFAPDGCKLQF